MASKLSSQLKLDPQSQKGVMGDFAHASNLFVDSDMRLAPKVKFLYHVVFEINTNALLSLGFKYKHQNELNMLVRKVDLPKFSIQTETLNQYNRKKVMQKRIEYQPVNIVFHDDSYGITRQLWENYYNYYYADQTATKVPGGYAPRNSTRSGKLIIAPYGLDSDSTEPFFSRITIYQLSRGEWNSYSLINPLITAWSHDSLDYSQNAAVDNNMTVIYEAVEYKTGTISSSAPQGFASEHYDVVKSPLTLSSSGSAQTVQNDKNQLAGSAATGQVSIQQQQSILTTLVEQGNKTVIPLSQPTVSNAGSVIQGIYIPGATK